MTTLIPPEPALTETVGDAAISVSNGKHTICDVHAWSQNTSTSELMPLVRWKKVREVEAGENQKMSNISLSSIPPTSALSAQCTDDKASGLATGAGSPAE